MEKHHKMYALANAIYENARLGYDEEDEKYIFQIWGAIYELADALKEYYSKTL